MVYEVINGLVVFVEEVAGTYVPVSEIATESNDDCSDVVRMNTEEAVTFLKENGYKCEHDESTIVIYHKNCGPIPVDVICCFGGWVYLPTLDDLYEKKEDIINSTQVFFDDNALFYEDDSEPLKLNLDVRHEVFVDENGIVVPF